MEADISAFPVVLLFTDGAFSFAHRSPGSGWMAINPEAGREIALGRGSVRNDGTTSQAVEAASVALALEWAIKNGF